jgi:hypothetical protein
MWKRLIELAVEVDKLSPQANHQSWSFYACKAADTIAVMRDALEKEQAYQKEGEEFRRRWGKG